MDVVGGVSDGMQPASVTHVHKQTCLCRLERERERPGQRQREIPWRGWRRLVKGRKHALVHLLIKKKDEYAMRDLVVQELIRIEPYKQTLTRVDSRRFNTRALASVVERRWLVAFDRLDFMLIRTNLFSQYGHLFFFASAILIGE